MRSNQVAGFLVLVFAGCSGESVAPSASNVEPIYGGIVDRPHASVVGIGGNGSSPFCSGTVISRRTVITAGHCYGSIKKVLFGTNPTQAINVVQSVQHPSYNQGAGNDLTILKLASDSPAQPMPLLRETLTNTPAFIGPKFTFVGYGYDENRDYGTRKVATFPIAKIGPAQVPAPTNSIDKTEFYYAVANKNTCNGDSGGPAFAVRGGVERHAGATSWGDQDCVIDGVQSRTDLPAITEFIQPNIDLFEGTSACRNNGVCDESCNTGGQVWDPDCQDKHCGADGLCARACVAPADPDCTGVNLCGEDGICDPSCSPADKDCADLCPGGCGTVDAGPSLPDAAVHTADAAVHTADASVHTADAAVQIADAALAPDAWVSPADAGTSSDAKPHTSPDGGTHGAEGSVEGGCRVVTGPRDTSALFGPKALGLGLLWFAWRSRRRRALDRR